MTEHRTDQPLGDRVVDWASPAPPPRRPIDGRWCRLEPFDVTAHVDGLTEAFAADADGRIWTYLGYGPFEDAAYRAWFEEQAASTDPLFFAVRTPGRGGRPVGHISYLRIDPPVGVIEIGHLCFAPALQRTPASTEAVYLLLRDAFDAGYRRVEWRCHELNEPSMRAAVRLGFTYEGTLRQHRVVKGRNRDTAWYSMLDREWPQRRARLEGWLAAENFDEQGRQRRRLSEWPVERA